MATVKLVHVVNEDRHQCVVFLKTAGHCVRVYDWVTYDISNFIGSEKYHAPKDDCMVMTDTDWQEMLEEDL